MLERHHVADLIIACSRKMNVTFYEVFTIAAASSLELYDDDLLIANWKAGAKTPDWFISFCIDLLSERLPLLTVNKESI